MLRIFRGRWAATGFFFVCPGAVLACCRGPQPTPPLYWLTFDFDWQPRSTAPSEPFLALDRTFVSTQIPGQFATPAPDAAEGDPDERETGFRRSLGDFWTCGSLPPHLDGGRVDVTGETSEMEGCSDAILDFELAVQAHARWRNPAIDEDPQQPVANDLAPAEARELRFPLTGEVWEIAKPTEELAAAQRWLIDPETNVAPQRRLVFTGPAWKTVSTAPIEFDKFYPPSPTATVERIWPTRPTLATLVVSYDPCSRCRCLPATGDSLELRFPLALLSSEP